jgi:hypothetical protein
MGKFRLDDETDMAEREPVDVDDISTSYSGSQLVDPSELARMTIRELLV